MRGLCELDEALTIVGGAALQSQHAGDLVRAERIGQPVRAQEHSIAREQLDMLDVDVRIARSAEDVRQFVQEVLSSASGRESDDSP